MHEWALLHHWLCNQKHPWGICSCSPIVNFLKVTFYHGRVTLVIFLIKNDLNRHIKHENLLSIYHDDVIKWKHFPRHWPFVRGIHRSPVNSPHKGQWRAALMFTLICVWINGCVNNREAGDLRRYYAHYGVTVMIYENMDYFQIMLFTVTCWKFQKIQQPYIKRYFYVFFSTNIVEILLKLWADASSGSGAVKAFLQGSSSTSPSSSPSPSSSFSIFA